jgi:hypothetical protein
MVESLAHDGGVADVRFWHNDKFLVSLGKRDGCAIIWKVNQHHHHKHHKPHATGQSSPLPGERGVPAPDKDKADSGDDSDTSSSSSSGSDQ